MMKNITSRLVYVIAIFPLYLLSCSNSPLDTVSYVKWVEEEENGLRVKKEVGNYEFSLQYKPLEYITVIESKGATISQEKLQERTATLGGLDYYTFRITSKTANEMLKTDVTSEEQYQQRIYYFNTLAQTDVYVVQGEDTLACELYHFERNYGISPYNNMVLGMQQPKNMNQDRVFVYNDPILGVGPIKFTIRGAAIDNAPQLKLSQS